MILRQASGKEPTGERTVARAGKHFFFFMTSPMCELGATDWDTLLWSVQTTDVSSSLSSFFISLSFLNDKRASKRRGFALGHSFDLGAPLEFYDQRIEKN
jgi:hypothetical protein